TADSALFTHQNRPFLVRRGKDRGSEDRIADRCDQRSVLLAFTACLDPFRVALKRRESFFAFSERVPLKNVDQVLVRFANRNGPETKLPDSMFLEQPNGHRLEPFQQCWQAARKAMVDAQFVQ